MSALLTMAVQVPEIKQLMQADDSKSGDASHAYQWQALDPEFVCHFTEIMQSSPALRDEFVCQAIEHHAHVKLTEQAVLAASALLVTKHQPTNEEAQTDTSACIGPALAAAALILHPGTSHTPASLQAATLQLLPLLLPLPPKMLDEPPLAGLGQSYARKDRHVHHLHTYCVYNIAIYDMSQQHTAQCCKWQHWPGCMRVLKIMFANSSTHLSPHLHNNLPLLL